MGFLKFLKQAEAPKELPNLAFDDIKAQIRNSNSMPLIQKEQAVLPTPQFPLMPQGSALLPVQPLQQPISIKEEPFKPLPSHEYNNKLPNQNMHKQEKEIKDDIAKHMGTAKNEKSFFKEMLKDLDNEAKSVEQLDVWYQKRFVGTDVVSQMREYYEKQKPEMVIRNVGNELKDKVKEKTEKLHVLEQQWQEMYLQLLGKEEEIRKEEEHLKKMISEFVSLCEKHIGKQKKESRKA